MAMTLEMEDERKAAVATAQQALASAHSASLRTRIDRWLEDLDASADPANDD